MTTYNSTTSSTDVEISEWLDNLGKYLEPVSPSHRVASSPQGYYSFNIDAHSVSARNASVVELSVWLANEPHSLTATGSSKRAPGDVYDGRIGDRLAVADALRNLADEFENSVKDLL